MMNAAIEHASLEFAKPLQVDSEFEELIALLKREAVRSYLEVGARYGGSFEGVMMGLGGGARGTVIDFPGGPFGDRNSLPILLTAIDRLRRNDRKIEDVILGPSLAPEVVDRAKRCAPYDAVFIDADHSYQAVRRDFALYSTMAQIVIVHDIAAPPDVRSHDGLAVEVPTFWKKIKNHYRHEEIVAPGSLMGIGVVWIDGRRNPLEGDRRRACTVTHTIGDFVDLRGCGCGWVP